jgi:hypothetical protein
VRLPAARPLFARAYRDLPLSGPCNVAGISVSAHFDPLVRMFEQALKVSGQLTAGDRNALIGRLCKVRVIGHNFGYGVGDDMDSMLAKYVRD